jgi:UDP-glucose 4-epimerase
MTLSGSKVFVTGGAGFIGSFVVEELVRAGCRVTVYDNLRSGHRENLAAVAGEIEFLEDTILDRERLTNACAGHDAICHQAAQLEITRAIDDPVEDLETNTIGTLNVFEAARANGIEKVVFASSAGVYGQAVQTPQHEDDHPTEPNWAYGVSKLATEKYAAIYGELYGLRTVALRYGIVYGPREWYGRVLTIFLRRALDGESLVVFGDGEQVRDFVYVDDVVRANLLCLEQDAADGTMLNVSSATGTTINELAEIVRGTAGGGSEVVHEDVAEGESSRYYDRIRLPMELRTLVQANSKAKELLGWEPTVDLRDGIRNEYEWLQESEGRWHTMTY